MKPPYTPLRFLLKSSRRQLLSLHLVTGRIIILFVTLHAILYSIIIGKSIWLPKIAVALFSVVIFGIIGITSIKSFRLRAYSWFYKAHIIGSITVLPLLFFHVHDIGIYVLESATVVGLNFLLHIYSN